MPRVLHVVERFLPRSETFIYTMVNGHRAYEASVLCQARLFEREFPFPRVHVHARPLSKRSVGWWVNASVGLATGRSLWRREVEAVIAAVGPDVVHAHFGPAGCAIVDEVRAAGVPLVTSLYGVDAAVLPFLPRWKQAYARLFADGDLFLAEAPEMRKKVIAAGAPADRTAIHPISIDLSRYPRWTAPREPVVLFVARFIEKKGLLDAIAAFDRARARVATARMTIVGEGPDEESARALVDRLGCGACIEFVGSKPHAAVLDLLARAAALIHPSATAVDGDSEGGAPTILLEAQAIGTPIVATRHADIPNVAPEGAGVRLCGEHDVDALGAALAAALTSRQPSSASHVAAHHDVANTIVDLEAMYTRLTEAAALAR